MTKNHAPPQEARAEADIFADLETLCCSPGYIHAIAYLCFRDNIIRYPGKDLTENDIQHQYSRERLIRTEISTLIGLMAKGSVEFILPAPATIQRFVDQSQALLSEMHRSMQKPWVSAMGAMSLKATSSILDNPFSTAEALREPIFYSGESAYSFQYEELALKKYLNDDDWIKSKMGFSIKEACTLARKLGKMQILKIMNHREAMLTANPDHWTFLPGFVFEAHELAEFSGLSFDKTERILASFTVDRQKAIDSFSSLSSFNPTNSAPLIKFHDGTYALLQHYSLLEALYEAPFFWMVDDKSYAATAARHRGEFAENFIAECFVRVFGSEHVFLNVNVYRGKKLISESDVLVVFGDRAVVIQAKSKRLTIEARKGNDLQLKDDFKKAIHDAYDQALLCSQALLEGDYRFVLPSGDEIEFRKRPVRVFPICVVSDHYPALGMQSKQFLKIRSTDELLPPLVTDLFFIDVLTEILESPLHIINYLALRAKFDVKLLINQETVALGFHLKHNLWVEDKYDMVNLGDDFSGPLDLAMYARRASVPGKRTPEGILTRFRGSQIGRLISAIEKSGIPELVGVGLLLLQLGPESARHINNGLERLIHSSVNEGQHDLSVPAFAEKSGFTIHINARTEEIALSRLSLHCQIRKYSTRANSWYGLLLMPNTGEVRGALAIEEKWRADPEMAKIVNKWPKSPIVPISTLSHGSLRRKIGRNAECPCGSGKKYKRCCLNNR
jgi:hypothetical protein